MELVCAVCGKRFESKRSNAKTCSSTCRGRAFKARRAGGSQAPGTAPAVGLAPSQGSTGSLEAAVLAELEALGQTGTPEGVNALVLARRIASPAETGSAAASMTDRLTRLLDTCRHRAAAAGTDQLGQVVAGAASKLRLIEGG